MVHGIHWIRPLASLNILYLHTGTTAATYLSGVGILLVLSIALSAASNKSFTTLLRTRFNRLLVPWVWACAFYSVILALKQENPTSWIQWPNLFIGPYLHLWFLPAAFALNILSALLYSFLRPSTQKVSTIASVSCILLFSCILIQVNAPILFTGPAIILGLLLVPAFKYKRYTDFFVVGLLSICTALLLFYFDEHSSVVYSWTGLFLILMGIISTLGSNTPPPIWWQNLSESSYNVYLIHPFIQEVVCWYTQVYGGFFHFFSVTILSYLVALLWHHKAHLYQKWTEPNNTYPVEI